MARGILNLLVVAIVGCRAHQDQVTRHTDAADDTETRRITNLERAARYPWVDDGVCIVREASGDWKTLIERCYFALDLSRIRFQDHDHRCSVADADAAAIGQMVGLCLLVQPQVAVGAVIIIGAVVVAAAIAAELSKCKCMCMGIDDRGRRHGPYENGRTKNKFVCEQNCLQKGYAAGGFCK